MIVSYFNSSTVGEYAAPPGRYLDFVKPEDSQRTSAHSVVLMPYTSFPTSQCSLVIASGTVPVGFDPKMYGCPVIAWGADVTRCAASNSDFASVGSRLGGDGKTSHWMPCASCLSPAFDLTIEPSCDFAFFAKPGGPLDKKSFAPSFIDNKRSSGSTRVDQQRSISLIASAEVVITDVFHGAYWATLFNRHVVWCGKQELPFVVTTCDPEDAWDVLDIVDTSSPQNPGYLRNCRRLNTHFHAHVNKLLLNKSLPDSLKPRKA